MLAESLCFQSRGSSAAAPGTVLEALTLLLAHDEQTNRAAARSDIPAIRSRCALQRRRPFIEPRKRRAALPSCASLPNVSGFSCERPSGRYRERGRKQARGFARKAA